MIWPFFLRAFAFRLEERSRLRKLLLRHFDLENLRTYQIIACIEE